MILPRFLFENEDLRTLVEKNVKYKDKDILIDKKSIPCIEVKVSIDELIDAIYDNNLLEVKNTKAENRAYATRVSALIFQRIRDIAQIKDYETRQVGAMSAIAAINSLFAIEPMYSRRLISVVRAL